jgi:hypothetical protein
MRLLRYLAFGMCMLCVHAFYACFVCMLCVLWCCGAMVSAACELFCLRWSRIGVCVYGIRRCGAGFDGHNVPLISLLVRFLDCGSR